MVLKLERDNNLIILKTGSIHSWVNHLYFKSLKYEGFFSFFYLFASFTVLFGLKGFKWVSKEFSATPSVEVHGNAL